MPSLSHGEEELEHTGAVCGWFSADWVRESYSRRRRRFETPWLDLVTLVDEPSHNAFETLSDYLLAVFRNRSAESAGAEVGWLGAVHPKASAEAKEAVSAFASSVSGIEGVERVLFEETGDEVRVWTVMDEPKRDAEDRVYAAEAETLDRNPSLLFNFRILFRHGKALDHIRSAEARDAR